MQSPAKHVDCSPPRASQRQPSSLLDIDPHGVAEILTYFGVRGLSTLRAVCRRLWRLSEMDFVMREVLLNEVGRCEEDLIEAFLEFRVPLFPEGEDVPIEESEARRAKTPLVPRMNWSDWVQLCRSRSHDLSLVGCLGVGNFTNASMEGPDSESAPLLRKIFPCMGLHAVELSADDGQLLFGGGVYDNFDNLREIGHAVMLRDNKLTVFHTEDQLQEPEIQGLYGSACCRMSRNEILMFGGGTYHRPNYNINILRLERVEGDAGPITGVTWSKCWSPPIKPESLQETGESMIAVDRGVEVEVPMFRFGHSMVYFRGKCVLFGGRQFNTHYNDVWVLDPATLQWEQKDCTGRIPSERIWHKALVVGKEMLVVGGSVWFPGGSRNTPGWPEDRRGVYALNLETWEWSYRPGRGNVPPPALQQGVSRIGGHLLVTGGFSPCRRNYLKGIWAYDISRDHWELVSELRRPRASHAQAVVKSPPTCDRRAVEWDAYIIAGGQYMRRDMFQDMEVIRVRKEGDEGNEVVRAACALQ
eukprot:Hpha_TRINITY_DN8673_c0_g1::TRINITY_DN8673_c0_g1_i2::g.168681::m.168681